MRIIISILLLMASPVLALTPCVHEIDGKKFVCFNETEAQQVLRVVVEFPKLKEQLKIMEDMNFNLKLQIDEQEEMNQNLKKQIENYEKENVALQAKAAEGTRWYNSKILWLSIGLVVGSGIAVGVAAAIGR